MVVVNTCFRKREEHRITYHSDPSASQIGYFSVRQVDRKHVKNCTVILDEAAVKQHRLLLMDMRRQSVHTGYRTKQKPCVRRWKLKGENLAKFRSKVQEKMNNQKVTSDTLKYSIVEAAKSVCGVTRGQKRKERDTWWWSEDVQRTVKNKKESSKNWQKMRHDTSLKAVYKKTCKETKNVVAEAKQEATKRIYMMNSIRKKDR